MLRVADNGTGYYGVYLTNPGRSKPCVARVRRGGKDVYLGNFATAEEAALCVARSPEGQEAAQRAAAAPSAEERKLRQRRLTSARHKSMIKGGIASRGVFRKGNTVNHFNDHRDRVYSAGHLKWRNNVLNKPAVGQDEQLGGSQLAEEALSRALRASSPVTPPESKRAEVRSECVTGACCLLPCSSFAPNQRCKSSITYTGGTLERAARGAGWRKPALPP